MQIVTGRKNFHGDARAVLSGERRRNLGLGTLKHGNYRFGASLMGEHLGISLGSNYSAWEKSFRATFSLPLEGILIFIGKLIKLFVSKLRKFFPLDYTRN